MPATISPLSTQNSISTLLIELALDDFTPPASPEPAVKIEIPVSLSVPVPPRRSPNQMERRPWNQMLNLLAGHTEVQAAPVTPQLVPSANPNVWSWQATLDCLAGKPAPGVAPPDPAARWRNNATRSPGTKISEFISEFAF